MNMAQRIAVICPPPASGWDDPNEIGSDVAKALLAAGHEVTILAGSDDEAQSGPSLLTAVNQYNAVRRLLTSHRLALALEEAAPDLDQREHAGGNGIERAQMANFASVRDAAHLGDHVVRSEARRLVDDDEAVGRGVLLGHSAASPSVSSSAGFL